VLGLTVVGDRVALQFYYYFYLTTAVSDNYNDLCQSRTLFDVINIDSRHP
jgi:hypothetical protein